MLLLFIYEKSGAMVGHSTVCERRLRREKSQGICWDENPRLLTDGCFPINSAINSAAAGATVSLWTTGRPWRALKERLVKCFCGNFLCSQLWVFSLHPGYFIISFGKFDLVLFDPDTEGVLKKNMKYSRSALSFRGSNIPVCKPEMNSSLPTHLIGSIRGGLRRSGPVLVWKLRISHIHLPPFFSPWEWSDTLFTWPRRERNRRGEKRRWEQGGEKGRKGGEWRTDKARPRSPSC